MPNIQTKHKSNHHPDALFDVVSNLEKIPQFVSEFDSFVISNQTVAQNGDTVLNGKLKLSTFGMELSIKSTLQIDKKCVQIECLDGPFSHFKMKWTIKPIAKFQCELISDYDYEIDGWIKKKLIGAKLEKKLRDFPENFV